MEQPFFYLELPRSGEVNGLKLMIDLEGFEYAYSARGAKGVLLALADSRDWIE